MTYRQLIATCSSASAVAVLLGWLLARPDVWALQDSIDKLAAVVRELKVSQNQSVTVAGGSTREVIAELAKQIITKDMKYVHARTMREPAGDESLFASPAGGGISGVEYCPTEP